MPSMKIGDYLLKRLKEINIDTIFGVPGDYNMSLIDLIMDDNDLTWGYNANELNASYAADGYARVRGAGALITTFGVGELAASAGVAGSYAEMIPVIHIAGAPATSLQANNTFAHHTFGDGNFQVFKEMYEKITVASVHLTADQALEQINHVIQTAYIQKRPGYITMPIDLAQKEVQVSEEMLKPLDLKPKSSPSDVQEIVLANILELIDEATYPVIVADGCVLRHHLKKEANEFVKTSGFPTFNAPMGKGVVDEKLPNFRGCYIGKVSLKGIIKEIEQADLVIELGPIRSDLNTGNFSNGLEKKKTITLHSSGTIVHHAEYPDVGMADLLPQLTERLSKKKTDIDYGPRVRPQLINDSTTDITHNYLWNKVASYLPAGSVILSDTGTAQFASIDMDSPDDAIFVNQMVWQSIGYTVGAALGAAMADRNRRVFLFVGDGSFQLTAQEVSIFIRQGLTPVIVLINNDGYLIEKMVHEPQKSYNELQMWEYSKTLTYFGGHLKRNKIEGRNPSEIGLEIKVKTREEFENAMNIVSEEPNKIHFLEVITPKCDAPRILDLIAPTFRN